MVSMKILKDYDFKTITEYYDYILQSIINGQRQQAIALAEQMNIKQKKEAIEYLELYSMHNQSDECKKLILSTF